ncbi:MAG: TAXI family TRAP transporter solute-binding subunit [Clostridia bacterium]|nr:TAXI family TRAP transporter solute-binding subunit [Clostridia bacterium]
MKKFLAIVLVLVLAVSAVACGSKTEAGAPAAKKAALTMGTGGESGTYFAVGGVLANVLNEKNPDIMNVNVVSTGGSGDNLQNMAAGVYQLATVQSDVMTYAFNGTRSFEQTGKVPNVRILAGLYAETVQIVTTNPDIKTVEDLKGKKVCVGDVNSGTYFNATDVFKAYDMDIEKDVEPIFQSFGASTESLKDGKIDAAFLCAGAPTTSVVDLGTAKSVYLVSIDDAHMEKLLADCPFYAKYTIGKDVYKTPEDCQTVTVKATLVADAAISDDVAYAIVKTIFEAKDEITAAHAKGAEIDLTFATDGMAIPFHPGAAKYFAEKGITVDTGK